MAASDAQESPSASDPEEAASVADAAERPQKDVSEAVQAGLSPPAFHICS